MHRTCTSLLHLAYYSWNKWPHISISNPETISNWLLFTSDDFIFPKGIAQSKQITLLSSRWSTENKLHGSFEVPCPIMLCQGFSFIFESNILLLFIFILFIFFSLFILFTLCIYIIASKLVFQWIFECVNEWVSTAIPIYCAFSRTHLLLFAFPILMLVLLFYSILLLSLRSLSSNERQKRGESIWEGRWKEAESSWGRESHNQYTLSEKKYIFNKMQIFQYLWTMIFSYPWVRFHVCRCICL